MTAPRQVLPGQCYFVTRRCSDRRFFLVPSPIVNGIFVFCVAVAAELTSMQLHAVCVMSNHIHIVLTDPAGELPRFMAWLNRHSAICLKILRRRAGPIWEAGEKYSEIRPWLHPRFRDPTEIRPWYEIRPWLHQIRPRDPTLVAARGSEIRPWLPPEERSDPGCRPRKRSDPGCRRHATVV